MPLRREPSPGNPAPLEDPLAFTRLYERSHLSVFRYIYGLLGGPREEVEDLTAETFLRAWKARRRFRGDEHAALVWLMRISRNLVIDHHRRRKTHPPAEALENLPLSSPASNPEVQTLWQEQMRTLWRLVQNLPLRQREMLTLRYLLGWRVKQIAQHLEMPENTVSVNLRRTLARLRKDWPDPAERDPTP